MLLTDIQSTETSCGCHHVMKPYNNSWLYISEQQSLTSVAVQWKQRETKGWKMLAMALNPGCRYVCHASDSLTEPSGPATSQLAHIPISLHHEPKFSQDCHQAIPSHPHSLISTLTERGIARLGTWQLYSYLMSHFAVGTVLMHLNEKLSALVQICKEKKGWKMPANGFWTLESVAILTTSYWCRGLLSDSLI